MMSYNNWHDIRYRDYWLNQNPNDPRLSINTRKHIRYYRRLFKQTPKWVDQDEIQAIYRTCKKMREVGENVVVDHVVPLSSPRVCGLHWHGNLEIIHHMKNQHKSNHYWPDMWNEQLDLFD